jgi:hypothetical protein
MQTPLGVNWIAKGPGHGGHAIGATKSIKSSFATICHRSFDAIKAKFPTCMANGSAYLCSSCCSFEFVCCRKDDHCITLEAK